MKKSIGFFVLLLFFVSSNAVVSIGKSVPDFYLPDETGKMHHLSEWYGKKIALVFYPSGSTPYCRKQSETLRDEFIKLSDHDIVVIGINYESQTDHLAFKNELKLPFFLLTADDNVVNSFEVLGWFGYVARKTFLIDEKGALVKVLDDIKLTKHHEQILEGFGLTQSNKSEKC